MGKEIPEEVKIMKYMISLHEDEAGFHKKQFNEFIFCPESKDYLCTIVGRYIDDFEKHYEYLEFNNIKMIISVLFGKIFNELLMNAYEYGSKCYPDKKIKITLMFAEKGVMFSFRDGGDFFKSLLVKILFEGKQQVPTSDTKSGNHGTDKNHIYLADEIFVSNEENTIYVMKLFENINE